MKSKIDFDTIIKADTVLFFDMDGTLINTNYANYLSYEKAIQTVTKHGFDLSYDPKNRINRSFLKIALPNLSQADYERIIQKKEEYYKSFLEETKLNNDIAEVLYKYSKTNRTVLVTNCRKGRALMTLDHFGLTDKFDNIFYRQVTDNDKKINKFKNAISELGLSPALVVAFENEKEEIAYAIHSGIPIQNIFFESATKYKLNDTM